ncbi:MAG: hypothetical protein M0Z52_12265 [Actinomycetota bacterium]|nr:hypothetical protein [Nitrospiraceae bacterium]MDA8157203.1 hypothetical protein [Actinomycetota bacterium]
MKKSIVLFVIALLTVSGCVSYTPKQVAMNDPAAYTMRQTKENISLAIDPYYSADKQKKAFDTSDSMISQGLMPVAVIVKNDGDIPVKVEKGMFALMKPDGSQEKPVPVEDVYKAVKYSTLGRAVMGGAFAAASASNANEAMLADLKNKDLKDHVVAKDATDTGFLFFDVPKDIKGVDGYKIVAGISENGTTVVDFKIPLQ